MADETFAVNLMRMIAAELHVQNVLVASREMFGKGYFSLGVGEKALVEQAVFADVAGNFRAITPENLASQTAMGPVGFRAPAETSTAEKTSG